MAVNTRAINYIPGLRKIKWVPPNLEETLDEFRQKVYDAITASPVVKSRDFITYQTLSKSQLHPKFVEFESIYIGQDKNLVSPVGPSYRKGVLVPNTLSFKYGSHLLYPKVLFLNDLWNNGTTFSYCGFRSIFLNLALDALARVGHTSGYFLPICSNPTIRFKTWNDIIDSLSSRGERILNIANWVFFDTNPYEIMAGTLGNVKPFIAFDGHDCYRIDIKGREKIMVQLRRHARNKI